jgi:hypothetical protein
MAIRDQHKEFGDYVVACLQDRIPLLLVDRTPSLPEHES